MRLNFARLNHILIPSTNEERERWRRSGFGRFLQPIGALYEALTVEGQWVFGVAALTTVLSLEVDRTDVYLLWAALVGLMGGALLISRAFSLRGVRITVSQPPRVAIQDPVVFTVTLHNDTDADVLAVRVGGPFLPWDGAWIDGSWSGVAPTITRVPARGSASTTCRARFRARGEHHLDPFRAGALAPFGLTQGPAARTAGVRFIVVPRAARVERLGVALGQRHQPGGVAQAVQTGESMDLRGVRPYRAGDPVRDLHARSWARTGQPVVREYQQEYFRRVAVVLDTELRDADPERFEAAIAVAAGVVRRAAQEDALVDLLVVGREVHELSARGGSTESVLGVTLDVLACVKGGAAFDGEAAEAAVRPFVGRLSAVILVTLFADGARAAAAERLHRLGVDCVVVAVLGGDDPLPSAPARAVRADAVLRGDAVSL
jgi:uncharacterized protein (DUF58 family)